MNTDQPFIRVSKGHLDVAELAALTVALLVLAQAAPAPVPRAAPRWRRPERSRGFAPAASWRAAA